MWATIVILLYLFQQTSSHFGVFIAVVYRVLRADQACPLCETFEIEAHQVGEAIEKECAVVKWEIQY